MGAAQRMFDNSYNQRMETAALAKAYLDNPVVEPKVTKEEKEIKRIKNGRVCSIIGILTSMAYCLLIFGILLIPLVRETKIHEMQVEISQHKKEIGRLENEIEYVESQIDEKMEFASYEDTARIQLGMVKRDPSMVMPKEETGYVTLEEARNAFYNPTLDYMSQEEVTLD